MNQTKEIILIRIQDYLISAVLIRYCCILFDGADYNLVVSISADSDKQKPEAIVFKAATREIAEDWFDSIDVQLADLWVQ